MKGTPTNVRLTDAIHRKIAETAKNSGVSTADILRHSIALGLRQIEAAGGDLNDLLYKAIEQAQPEAAKNEKIAKPQPVKTKKKA